MARHQNNRTRNLGAGRTSLVLPALSSLVDLPVFSDLEPSGRQVAAWEGRVSRVRADAGNVADELVLGCVVRLDRGFPAVCTEGGTFRAEFSARVTKGDNSRVAVGDWVCARVPKTHEMGLIEEVLPRESDIARWRGGSRGERQTLAANVDVVLVVQALGERPVSCDRMARSAVIARDCGADVAVVLTKADRASDEVLVRDVSAIRDVLGEGTHCVLTSSEAERAGGGERDRITAAAASCDVPFGVGAVYGLVPAGVVAIVLGESGAGKSTLLNALLGCDVLETCAVREADDAGRHTTVSRRMVRIPRGGVIVDEPGLRSLPIVGHERGLAKVFPEIAHAARGCRFRDCTHTHEPGCEVRARFEAGDFSEGRLGAYLALAAEMRSSAGTLDPDVVI